VLGWPAVSTAPPHVAPRTGRQHAGAALQALLVTFLWSTSWILAKIGLDDLGLEPISFAGLR
jgi:drug/metabolite transporter (DMT)-like permease